MKLPRDLSGTDLAKCLCREWGYRQVNQEGSHILLETDSPKHQRIAVPAHRYLRVGTLAGILKAVAAHKGLSIEEILRSIL